MDEHTIWITPFMGGKEKFRMWYVKFMERYGINGYHVLLTGAKRILEYYTDKK